MSLTIAGDSAVEGPDPERSGAAFASLVAEVARLHRINAQHRKGQRLQDVAKDPGGMLLHAASEIVEVYEAKTSAHAEQEMGDCLSILVHFCLAHGLDLVKVCERWLAKVPADFPRASKPPPLSTLENVVRP